MTNQSMRPFLFCCGNLFTQTGKHFDNYEYL